MKQHHLTYQQSSQHPIHHRPWNTLTNDAEQTGSKSHTVTDAAIGTPSNKSVLRLEQNAGNVDGETTLPKYVASGQLNHYIIIVSKRRQMT